MKKILAIMLFAFACNLAFAQTDENRKAAFHLSFVSPLGTNGIHSAQTTNTASLNLLVGLSKNEEAFTLGGLSNVILNDAKGVQFAGLVNVAKNVRGVQFGGLINIAENSDVPIGLINIIKNGEMGIAVTYDGIGNAVASFRSGGKYTYGI